MAFFAGKNGKIIIRPAVDPAVQPPLAQTTLTRPLTEWSIDIKAAILDTTNFDSDGFEENIVGVITAEISASGPYDGNSMNVYVVPQAANVPYSNPSYWPYAPVDRGSQVEFFLDIDKNSSGKSFKLTATISSIKIDSSVKDIAKISYSATASGPFGLTASVTAATGNGTTITYTAANSFTVGQIVAVAGLGSSSGESLNISNMVIATVSSSQFTVTNPTVGVSSGAGTAGCLNLVL